MIIDARVPNDMMFDPPGVSLLTSEGLADIQIELPPGVQVGSEEADSFLAMLELYLAMGDVKNAFHWLVMPAWLSEYFGFDEPMRAADSDLVSTDLDGVILGPDDIVYCLCRSLPMGCK